MKFWRRVGVALFVLFSACVNEAAASPGGVVFGPPPVPDTIVLPERLERVFTSAREPSGINPLEVLDGAGALLAGRMGVPASGAFESGARGGGGGGEGTQSRGGGLSPAINIMLILTVVSLAPSIMLMTTCFLRIMIVIGMLKQALGTPTIPPPQVITALSLFMTLLVMAPTVDRIHAEAVVPYQQGQIGDYDELWERSKQPVRDFMFNQIEATGNWSSLYMVLEYRGVDVSRPELLTRADVDMVALVPAYMLSELKTAFLMGFRVYLPFLVIDMVISSVLISMSMMMLPPVLISLPFKLLLFVLVDGWTLVVGSLMHSFALPTPEATSAMNAAGDVMTFAMQQGHEVVKVAWMTVVMRV
jgi:flagellar biosynthesis protein FliP